MFYPILTAIAGLLPALVLILRLKNARLRKHAIARIPFPETLPRPPGEHLRLQIDELERRYNRAIDSLLIPCILVTAFAVISSLLGIHSIPLVGQFSIGALVLVSASFSCYSHWPDLGRILRDLENYRLGFEGERHVGSILTALERDGYSVFHDLAISNSDGHIHKIDHIALGPAGIFAVETNTRRKKGDPRGSFEITPRGNSLEFSDGHCSHEDLDIVRERIWELETWLCRYLRDPGPIHPVLTFPGWSVNCGDIYSDIPVLNPGDIRQHILATDRSSVIKVLDPTRIAALRSLLSTACGH